MAQWWRRTTPAWRIAQGAALMCVASVLWLLALLTESRHSPWRSLLVLWVVGFVAGTAVFALLPRRDTGDRSG